MSYDKSHIPAFADDVVNGRIDESAALALFSEDLQRILKVEIGKRLRNRGYDRDNIGNTTDKGLSYLADDIVLGLVGEDEAFNLLKFKVYHKPLREEISKRREDEILWNQALASQTLEMFEKYLDTYNNPDSTYVGRYVTRAEENIQHIADDDKEWADAKRLDTEDAYLKYLDIYDKPAPSYRGKHIKEVKEAIIRLKDNSDWALASNLNTPAPDPRIKDDEAWNKATKANTIESYQEYLTEYGHTSVNGYVGLHIQEAEWAIRRIIDEEAWSKAKSLNTIDGYHEYKDICDANNYPGYNWAHYNAASTHIGNLQKAEDVRLQKEADNTDWSNALRENTIEAYHRYLRLHNAGIHRKEALDAIAKLGKQAFVNQENKDWQAACKANTLSAYKSFVAKYSNPSLKYKSAHLDAAKQKVIEITTPDPVPTPIKWWKWIGIAIVLVLGCLTYVQWKDNAWPFNIKSSEEEEPTATVEKVDSLTWAITNHNIPVLQRYADMDSTRALYPLSLELWNQRKDTLNSLIYIREALSTIQSDSPLFTRYINQLEMIKGALDYNNTIGHKAPPLSSNIGERLLVLPTEYAIIKRSIAISEKYSFEYTPNVEVLKFIEDDFRRWVDAGDDSPVRATKEDCYKAALQLKEDREVRNKLNNLTKQ